MIRAWVEVVAYHQGVAMVRALPQPGCGTCSNRSNSNQHCCMRSWLPELFPKQVGSDLLSLSVPVPLRMGQQLELGILATDLLRSALLVYLCPLGGLLLGGGLLQGLAVNELWVIAGALVSAGGGWLLARYAVARRCNYNRCQPIILRILRILRL